MAKNAVPVILLAWAISFALLSPLWADAAKSGGSKNDTPPRPDKQLGTSEMKWTPVPDPWVACERNGVKCRCSGDIVDCRAPADKKPAAVKAKQEPKSRP